MKYRNFQGDEREVTTPICSRVFSLMMPRPGPQSRSVFQRLRIFEMYTSRGDIQEKGEGIGCGIVLSGKKWK